MEKKDLNQLSQRLSKLSKLVEKECMRKNIEASEKTKLSLSLEEKREASLILLQVVELFKSLGGEQEEDLLKKLETFVSFGLASVFGESYEFKTQMGVEGKDLRVDFFVQTGELQGSVTDARGGGVAEVVSILLQLFFIICQKGRLAPFLLLDTALVHLSEEFHGRMSALLKELCEHLGLQILLFAHSGEYGNSADCLYRFSQEDGKTVVVKER